MSARIGDVQVAHGRPIGRCTSNDICSSSCSEVVMSLIRRRRKFQRPRIATAYASLSSRA
jgi:hypothetical protein